MKYISSLIVVCLMMASMGTVLFSTNTADTTGVEGPPPSTQPTISENNEGTSWPTFFGDLDHSGYTNASGPLTNLLLWSNNTGSDIYSSPTIADGKVFIGNIQGRVQAYDALTGQRIFDKVLTGGDYGVSSTPAYANGHVVVYCNGNDIIYRLNATTGNIDWSYDTGSPVYGGSSAIITNGTVWIGSANKYFYCLDEITGTVRWSYQTGNGITRNYGVCTSPAVDDQYVYFGACDGYLYCFNRDSSVVNPSFVWRTSLTDSIFGSPMLNGDYIYCGVGVYNQGEGSVDCYKMFMLWQSNGTIKHTYTTNNHIMATPAYYNNTIYFGSEDNYFYALDADDLTLKWSYQTFGDVVGSAAIADGMVYFSSKDNKVYCLNADDGSFIWSYTTGGEAWSSCAVVDGVVYTASLDDHIYAIGFTDESPPEIAVNQREYGWYSSDPGNVIDVDFDDLGGSPLDFARYHTQTSGWIDIFTSDCSTYTTNWGIGWSALSEGNNTITIQCNDTYGNQAQDQIYVLKDTLSPTITMNNASYGWFNIDPGAIIDIDFANGTTGSPLWNASYKIVGIPPWNQIFQGECTQYTTDWSVNWAQLSEGMNTVNVRCYDKASNQDTTTDSFTMGKDTLPPTVTVNTASYGWYNSDPGNVIDVDFTAGGGSDLDNASYRIGSTGPWTHIFTSDTQGHTGDWGVPWTSLAEGESIVFVRTFDLAGNEDTTPDSVTFKKDTVAPVITVNQRTYGWYTSDPGAVIDVDFSNGGAGSPLVNASYRIEGGDWVDIFTSPISEHTNNWSISWGLMQQGNNTIYLRTYDEAGNIDSGEQAYFWKDTTPPTITINTQEYGWYTSDPGPVMDVDFHSGNGGSDLVNASYRIGASGPWHNIFNSICTDYTTDWSVDWNELAEGENTVFLRCFDEASNSNTSAPPLTVKKDTLSPIITINQFVYGWYGSDPGAVIDVDFHNGSSGSDLANASYRIGLTGQWHMIFSSQCTDHITDWSVSWSELVEGDNTIYIRCYDEASNVNATSPTITVKKDTFSPIITINQQVYGWYYDDPGAAIDVDFSNGNNGSLLQNASYKVGALGSWIQIFSVPCSSNLTNWSVNWLALQEGNNTIHVRTFDEAGNEDLTEDVIYVLKDTGLPLVSLNQEIYGWYASDPGSVIDVDFFNGTGGSPLTNASYRIGATGSWHLIFSTTCSNFTTNWSLIFSELSEGENTIYIRCFNDLGKEDATNDTITVKKDTLPPTITVNTAVYEWYSSNPGNIFDIDFSSSGGSPLENASLRIAAGQWYSIFETDCQDFNSDWGINATCWSQLLEGSNTIFVRTYDLAGHFTTDSFTLKVDTTAPYVTVNRAIYGWYTTDPGPVIDVDFSNGGGGSLLDYAQYKIGLGGTWTDIFTGDVGTYTTNWSVPWGSLPEGNNTIYIRLFDAASNEDATSDTIWFAKDLLVPTVTVNIASYGWYTSDPGSVIDVDFSNGGTGSLLDYAQYKIGAGGTWTDIFIIDTASYTTNWAIPWALLAEGSNTIYIRVYDLAAHQDTTDDQITVFKDTIPPTVTINQAYYGWYTSDPGAVIDVDFSNGGTGSLLDHAQYRIGLTGTWTDIFTIDTGFFNADWDVVWSDLQEGNNTIYIRVYDVSGHEDATVDTIWITKDSQPPVVTINTASYGWFTSDPGSVIDVDFSNGGGGSPLDYAQYKIGIGGTWTDIFTSDCSGYTSDWTVLWSALSEGSNTIYIRVIDVVGHEDTTTDQITITKDVNPPLITINQVYYGWYSSDPGAVIDVDFTNGGSGSLLDHAQYKVGSSGTWTDIFTSDVADHDTDWAVTWSDLVEGNNTIHIRVYDVASHEDTSSDMIWVLKDDGYPVVTVNTASYGWYTSDPGAVIDVDFSNGGFGSSLDYAQYRIGISGTWTDIFTSNTPSYTANWAIDWEDLPEGSNVIYIRVFDIASHEDITSDTINFQKDTIAPENALAEVSIEMGAPYISDNTLDFTWDGFSDDGGSGIHGYYYSISDEGGTSNGTWSTISTGQVSGANEGPVSIHVWASDIAGNIGLATNDSIIVDLSSPTPGIVSIENDAQYANRLVLDITWSGFTDALTTIEGYYYSISDGSGTESGQWTISPYAQLTAPGNGTFTVFVWAKDVVGNIGVSASDDIIVQLPSALDISATSHALRGHPASITANATDSVQAEGSLTCQMEYRQPGGSWTALASTYIGTSPSGYWRTIFTAGINYQLGTYEVRVRFINGGSISTTWLYDEISVLNNLPEIEFTSDPSAPEDNELVLELGDAKSDVEDTRPSLLWSVVQFDEDVIDSVTGEGSSYDIIHFEPIENYYGTTMVLLKLMDSDGGYALKWVNLTWSPVNDPPILVHPIPDLHIPEDGSDATSVDLACVFFDPDDETLDYTVSGNGYISIMISEDGKVTFSPTSDWTGLEVLTFTATDKGSLSAKDMVDVDVYEANDDPPLFVALPDLELLEDTVLAHPLNLNDYFTDLDTPALTYSVGVLEYLQVTIHPNGSVTITPLPNWFGSVEVTFSARDGSNAPVSDSMTVTVTPVNDPPVALMDSAGPTTMTQGTVANILGHGEDIDGDVLRFQWTSDRDGTVGTSMSLTLSGLSVGEHIITFRVQDDGGLWSEDVIMKLSVNAKEYVPAQSDIDGDGIPDSQDPDMDGDGIPNPQDTDTDGDGLPDSWEQRHGLSSHDPNDALLDRDNDGFTNIQEYNGGSDPNSGIETPETLLKENSSGSSGIFEKLLIVIAVIVLVVILVAVVVLRGRRSKKPTQQPVSGPQPIPAPYQRPNEVRTRTPQPHIPTPTPNVPSLPVRYPVKSVAQPSHPVAGSQPSSSTILPTAKSIPVRYPVKPVTQPSHSVEGSQPSTPTISPPAKSLPVRYPVKGVAKPSQTVSKSPAQPPAPQTVEVRSNTVPNDNQEDVGDGPPGIDKDIADHGAGVLLEIVEKVDTEEVVGEPIQEKEPIEDMEASTEMDEGGVDMDDLFDV